MKGLLFISLLFIGCEGKITPGKMIYDGNVEFKNHDIRYFQDERTQKCFAERGIATTYSFTCVPCDSLVMTIIKNNKD